MLRNTTYNRTNKVLGLLYEKSTCQRGTPIIWEWITEIKISKKYILESRGMELCATAISEASGLMSSVHRRQRRGLRSPVQEISIEEGWRTDTEWRKWMNIGRGPEGATSLFIHMYWELGYYGLGVGWLVVVKSRSVVDVGDGRRRKMLIKEKGRTTRRREGTNPALRHPKHF